MADSKDVELRIRAKDYSKQTLDQAANALDKLVKAQDEQIAAAKRGEVSARQLERGYQDIQKAAEALLSQNTLINVFRQQAEAVKAAADAVADARRRQEEFAASVKNVETLSKEQRKTQRDLASEVARGEKAELRRQDALNKTIASLDKFGISANGVNAAQQRIVQAVNAGNDALDRQQKALDTVDADIARSAAVQKQAAEERIVAAQRQAEAERIMVAAAKAASEESGRLADLRARGAAETKAQADAERRVTDALRASAEQADATAKGYDTLARSVKSIRGDDLANQLKAIADPAGTALKSLQGVQDEAKRLGTAIDAIKGPVKDFRATMQALDATQKAAVGIGAQIDAYRRQIDVLRAAGDEYGRARTAVAALTQQMRAGGGDAAELSRQLTVAQAALKSAATNMSTQLGAAKELRTALQQAGVSTRDLKSAEDSLVGSMERTASSMKNLNAAYREHGAATDKAAKSQFQFLSGGRTTLGYTQRLKGELLALASAYIGVQAAIGLATTTIETFKTQQKLQSGLMVAFGGDTARVAEEMTYLRAASDRLGVSFAATAPAYAKFAIAAQQFGFTGKETRFVFENLAKASVNAGLSASDFEGVLKAVEQMLSKGKIQAEELRGQLGDRLPGAFIAAAKGAGLTVEEFSKMMELGGVGAENVINLARQLGQDADKAGNQAERLTAAQARFNNAMYDLQLAIGNSGFIDAFTKLLNDLTAFFNSDAGKKFAGQIGEAFTSVVNVMRLLIDNIELVKTGFIGLLAIPVIQTFAAIGTSVVTLVTAMRALYTITVSVTGAFAPAAAAVGVVATAAGAAFTKIDVLRNGLIDLIKTMPGLAFLANAMYQVANAMGAINKAKAKGEDVGAGAIGKNTLTPQQMERQAAAGVRTEDPGTGGTASKRAFDRELKQQEKDQKKADRDRKAANTKSVKDQLDARADLIKEEYGMRRDAIKREITDKEQQSKALIGLDKLEKQALETDRIKFENENAKSGAAAADKRVSLAEQVKNGILKIEDELARDSAKLDKESSFEDRRKTRVDAIAHAYDALQKTISKLRPLDAAAAEDADKKLKAFIKLKQQQEEIKVTTEEVAKLEKDLDDQVKLRTDALTTQKNLYDAGKISQAEYLANARKITDESEKGITTAADKLSEFAKAAKAANNGVLTATKMAEIDVKVTNATAVNPGLENAKREADAQIAGIDALIAKRDQANELYKQQFELRMISEDEYAQKVNTNNDSYKTKLLDLITVLQQQLELTAQQGLADGTLNTEKLAALDAQIAKYGLLALQIKNAQPAADSFQKALNSAVSGGIDQALNGVADALAKIASGQASVADGFKALGQASAQWLAQFLLDIAKAIIKQQILNALTNSGNPYLAAAGAAAGGIKQNHEGAIVGRAGGIRRNVNPMYFQGAPRFHEGGFPGLKSDEVPAILQKGEQVLARDDPNNILNGASRTTETNLAVRTVLVDDARNIPAAMQSSEGEKVLVQFLRNNAPTVRQIVRG